MTTETPLSKAESYADRVIGSLALLEMIGGIAALGLGQPPTDRDEIAAMLEHHPDLEAQIDRLTLVLEALGFS